MTLTDTGSLELDIRTLGAEWREGRPMITAEQRLKFEPPNGGCPANPDQAQIKSSERKDLSSGRLSNLPD